MSMLVFAAITDVALLDYFKRGGFWMYPLLICSVLALTVIFYKGFSFRRIGLDIGRFLTDLTHRIRQDGLESAQELCANNGSPVAAVVEAGLGVPRGNREVLREVMDEAARQEVSRLEHYLPTLSTVASIAPLLGFLGTVTGMINAFDAIVREIREGAGDLNPDVVAGGISQALITTAFGLMVAIPVYVAYNYFVARVRGFERDIDAAAAHVVNELCPEEMQRAA